MPGETFTYALTAGRDSAGVWPYHDHSQSMEESIAGGMYGALSIAGRHEQRPDREFLVTFAAWHGFQTIDGRAFVGNTPVFRAKVGERVQWDVMAMGDEFHTFHVHGHRWRNARRHAGGHARARPGRVVPRELEGGRARHVALPLPRRDAHDAGDDRPLPGGAVRRAAIVLATAAAALLVAPAAAQAGTETIAMPGKFFDPPRVTAVAGDVVTWRNTDFATHDVRDRGRAVRLGADPALGELHADASTARASTRSSARCTRSCAGASASWPRRSRRRRARCSPAARCGSAAARRPGPPRSRSSARRAAAPGRRSPPSRRRPTGATRSPRRR